MPGNILNELQRRLREEMNTTADYMATDGCHDLAAYKKAVGKIEGLAIAERELLDLVEREERANGDNDEMDGTET